MARRKRASMREGPLADLFRSTVPRKEAGPEGTEERAGTSEEKGPGPESPAEGTTEVQRTQEPAPRQRPAERVPPEPEEVSVYRVEAEREAPEPPGARERLRHAFIEGERAETPAFGREEPIPGHMPARLPVTTPEARTPVIRVVGVGGAGVNAVNRMVEAGVQGVEFLAVNTDLQSLQTSMADVTVHIGGEVTRGLGSGSDAVLGYRAAFEEQDKIKRLLKGSDMVFVTAGVGGGTGTGGTPVIARLARTVGALTVGIVTKPFSFEGTRRAKLAEEGIAALSGEVDTLIVVPNERLLEVLSRQTSMVEAFRVADDVLRQGVQGIADLVTLPALINLDFADVRTTMRDAGEAILGIGMGTGDSRATFAAERAIASPLLENSVDGARSILLSITGGPDLSLIEVSEAAQVVHEAAHPDANIIFGANVDESLAEQVWVTVIATRFDGRGRRADGTSVGYRRRTARPSAQRPSGELEAPIKPGKPRPRDLGIDVPEFLPNR